MTKSCQHHVSYEGESVNCAIHGVCPPTRCSGCKDFLLRKPAVQSPVEVRHEEKEVIPVCEHLGPNRRCCSALWICRKHGDITLDRCKTCVDFAPKSRIAPRRNDVFENRPWEGGWRMKPWDFRVTVGVPVLDAFDAIEAIVALLRLQTVRPYIVLVDTGSTDEQLKKIQSLASEDCEVHSLRLNGVRHPSDFPSIAMDLVFSVCTTEFVLATHADCFLMSRTVIEEMVGLCGKHPVVGYQITPRPHSDWRGMVGHTLTMFHMPTMDKVGASWSMRRLIRVFPHPDGKEASHRINPATSPNWPDTELLINYQCRSAGIEPLIIGEEENASRTLDHRIDHCRSWASANIYSSGSDYASKSNGWLQDGISKAWQRVGQWSERNGE